MLRTGKPGWHIRPLCVRGVLWSVSERVLGLAQVLGVVLRCFPALARFGCFDFIVPKANMIWREVAVHPNTQDRYGDKSNCSHNIPFHFVTEEFLKRPEQVAAEFSTWKSFRGLLKS